MNPRLTPRRAVTAILAVAIAASALTAAPAVAASTPAPAAPGKSAVCPAPPNDRFGASQRVENKTGYKLVLKEWHANKDTVAEKAPAKEIANGQSDTPVFANWQPCEGPQVWINYDVVDASGTTVGQVQAYVNVDWVPLSWKATNAGFVLSGKFNAAWGNDGHSPCEHGTFGAWATFTAK